MMNAHQNTNINQNIQDPDLQKLKSYDYDEIDLLDLLTPIFKNANFIIKWTFYIFLLSIIVSLILPKTYKATGKILPPQTQSSISQQLLSQLSGIMGIPQGAGAAIKDTSALYSELLKTNSVIDYVIDENNLEKIYKETKRVYLRKKVVDKIVVESDKKTGIMTIGYIDKSPELAYKIVISLIEGLKKLNNELAITEASQRRMFYETQLKNAKENLINSEEEMRKFQLKTGSIKIDEEAKASIEEISAIRAKISAKEVQLKVLASYATKESPEYKTLENEISALKDQLLKLQSKIPAEDDTLLSTKKVSSYGVEYIRKYREFKYNEALYEILLKQYEAAKLDEAKDSTIIQIIEKPEIPTIKYSPKRRKIVLTSTFIAFFILIFLVFLKTFYENLQNDPQSKTKISEIKKSLKNLKNFKTEIFSDIEGIRDKLLGIRDKG